MKININYEDEAFRKDEYEQSNGYAMKPLWSTGWAPMRKSAYCSVTTTISINSINSIAI